MTKDKYTISLFTDSSQKPINRFYKRQKQNVSCSCSDRIAYSTEKNGNIVAVGFVRTLPSGQNLLRSLYVDTLHRRKKLGQLIVELLCDSHNSSIWLQCEPALTEYYRRFDFKHMVISEETLQRTKGITIKKGHILMYRP